MTNGEARCNKSLRPRKPEGSLGRTAQDVHLDSHTAPELRYGGGGRRRLYTYRYTVTTRMIPALRWAAMSRFNVSVECDEQSHRTVSTNHNLFEEKGEPKRYRTEVLPLTNLISRPNRLTFSFTFYWWLFI